MALVARANTEVIYRLLLSGGRLGGIIIIIIDHLRMQPDGYGAVIYIF